MFRVENLIKKYKNHIAVNNVSFQVKEGECVAIVGSNGAGKTTLIETIIGINKPTSGKIYFDFKYKKSPQEKIGVQFQDSEYPEGLLTIDIINFFNEVSIKQLSNDKILEISKLFEMDTFLNKYAHSLSGGQKQKLNVLLAFISSPKLVFLDELTTGLDIKVRKNITNFVQEYIKKNNTTLVLVSHNETEIKMLCNRIIVMQNGLIVVDETVKHIETKYGSIEKLMGGFI